MKKALFAFLLPGILFAYTSPGEPSGFVNDFAGILSTTTVSTLNADLQHFSTQTGNEISLVTIESLGDETIETYAEKLFQEWGIGKEKEDNGVLLLISSTDRAVRIEVGYGLEPVVTDISSGRIIREIIIPKFQENNFDQGVTDGIHTILGLIGGEALPETEGSEDGIDIWMIVTFIIYLLIMYKFRKRKGGMGGGIPPIWFGGRGGGGGFGGFGGGMSGGGGSSGRW